MSMGQIDYATMRSEGLRALARLVLHGLKWRSKPSLAASLPVKVVGAYDDDA